MGITLECFYEESWILEYKLSISYGPHIKNTSPNSRFQQRLLMKEHDKENKVDIYI